ncbi:MAG TPA: alpha/beta hydrolase [Vicinamibacterales bacterium]
MTSNDGYLKTSEGYRLYFIRCGAGEPLLLVPHGVHLRDHFDRFANGRTMAFYDVRNRGRSEPLEGTAVERGIHHDVDDLDAARRSFHAERIDVIAHSYMATMPILYALKYPEHVNRIVQIGPMPPDAAKEYPPELKNEDDTLRNVLARLGELERERSTTDPMEFCRKFWEVLGPLFVMDPADARKVRWDRCDAPNERNGMKYWTQTILPSIKALALTREMLGTISQPVLVIHGRKDRSSPYGGGLDWAASLGNARLLTVENAAHAPWIEAPDLVFGAIETFLEGNWPSSAVEVGHEVTKATKNPPS